jgi:hypothetical protein
VSSVHIDCADAMAETVYGYAAGKVGPLGILSLYYLHQRSLDIVEHLSLLVILGL